MKSGLTPLFSDADIDRWFDKFQERAEERIFKLLSAAGEKFVEVARKSGNYTDRTGSSFFCRLYNSYGWRNRF